ncbi:hypothetical protein C8F01DRAFT_1362255 [Mycena amicta]|nr:hypothetical protein C8F01DRAFT_1362255 [Mycena amicta]
MAPGWWIDGPTTRGTYELVSSCVFTLGLCVWTAIHLNIPEAGSGARHSIIKFMRKIVWLTTGLMAPEVVTFIAWNQYSSAHRLVNELSSSTWKKKKASSDWNTSPKLVGLDVQYGSQPVPEDTDAVEPPPFGADWKLIHGFYVVMGGYVVDFGESAADDNRFLPDEIEQLTLTPEGLLFLAQRAPEFLPRISEEDIQDKSKADGLAKLLVAVQAAWFVLQSVARWAQHLPISLLEITTGAHALYTLFTYLLWAKKTLEYLSPDYHRRERCDQRQATPVLRLHPEIVTAMKKGAECQWVEVKNGDWWDGAPIGGNVYVLEWLQPKLPGTRLAWNPSKYEGRGGLPVETLHLQPEDVVRWRLVSAALSAEPSLEFKELEYFVLRSSNVPTYESWKHATKRMILGFTAAEVFYGLIHAGGWNATFASANLRLVWRVAACVISGGGLFLGGAFAWAAGEESWYGETFSAVVVVGTIEFVIRMFLLVEAFLNVGALPPGVYVLPRWSTYIPHWA